MTPGEVGDAAASCSDRRESCSPLPLLHFILYSLSLILSLDVEVSELVLVLTSGNNAEILLEVLLLKVLLGQVLKVSLGERNGGLNYD